MKKLRRYQVDFKSCIYDAWNNGHKNILGVLPTGAGKTVITSSIAKDFQGYGMFIAHRSELLSQISLQLAREGIYHDLVTPRNSSLRRQICDSHMVSIGTNYIRDRSSWLIGGVDTVVRIENDTRWQKLGLLIIDEAHHLQKENKWGKVFQFAPQSKLLGVTATPQRSDGKPLDTFEVLVEGATMRQLIDDGFLTDYRILCPKTTDLDLTKIAISGTTGDYNLSQIKQAVHASRRIVGDVVREYINHANGKLGVTFAVDVEEAIKIAKTFNDNGVPAEVISAKTPNDLRMDILRKFKSRKILQLVNVDLFGEGFDLPAIEVVSLARPTMSLGLFIQQFGRALRLMISDELMENWDSYTSEQRKRHIAQSEKPFALIIDHVGNTLQHGLPDSPKRWSLAGRDKNKKSDAYDSIPLRNCLNVKCTKVYERKEIICPYCGTSAPLPQGRILPEEVDGDLMLLTEEALAAMRNEIAKVDGAARVPKNLEHHIKVAIINKHVNRQVAQKELRETIALWAGKYNDVEDRINHKRFYLTFGITVLEAKAFGSTEAEKLNERIKAAIIDTFSCS